MTLPTTAWSPIPGRKSYKQKAAAQTSRSGLGFLQIRSELEQVQPGNGIVLAVYCAVQNIHHHLTGGADHRPVQMSAEHLALVVAGAHVQVGVECAVHG